MIKHRKTSAPVKRPLKIGRFGSGPGQRYDSWSPEVQLTAWLLVAAIAVVYLFLMIGGAQEEPRIAGYGADRRSKSAHAPGRLAGEVEALRLELSRLKRREAMLETRITDLQTALGPTTSALAPDPDASKTHGPGVAVTRSPLPGDGFGDGLLERSPVPIASPARPTRTLFGVELGKAASADGLRVRWRALLAKYPAQLAHLEARTAAADPRAPAGKAATKLIAGPFGNAADAATLCVRLEAREQACEQTIFAGEKLGDAGPALPPRKPTARRN